VKSLYVGNLPYQASEENLRDWLRQAGFGVGRVTVMYDRYSGEPRGFGFVEISDDKEAARAILVLNGKEFLGRRLVVNEARPRRESGKDYGRVGRRGW